MIQEENKLLFEQIEIIYVHDVSKQESFLQRTRVCTNLNKKQTNFIKTFQKANPFAKI